MGKEQAGRRPRSNGFVVVTAAALSVVSFAAVVAVSALGLGLLDEARRLWLRALELDPDLSIVRDNLDDLARSPAEREGPWPFLLDQLIPDSLIGDLRSCA